MHSAKGKKQHFHFFCSSSQVSFTIEQWGTNQTEQLMEELVELRERKSVNVLMVHFVKRVALDMQMMKELKTTLRHSFLSILLTHESFKHFCKQ